MKNVKLYRDGSLGWDKVIYLPSEYYCCISMTWPATMSCCQTKICVFRFPDTTYPAKPQRGRWKTVQITSFFRDHSGHGISQGEEVLHSNTSSHWLSPYPEWCLFFIWLNETWTNMAADGRQPFSNAFPWKWINVFLIKFHIVCSLGAN